MNQSYFNGTSWNTGITYYNGFPLAFFDGISWVSFNDWYIDKGVLKLPYFNGERFFTGTYNNSAIEPNPVPWYAIWKKPEPIWADKAFFTNRDSTTGYDYVCTNCGYNGYPAFYSNSGNGSKFYQGGSTANYGWIVNIEWQISIKNWSTPYFSGENFWNGTAWVGPGIYWDGSKRVTGKTFANGMYII